jgi:hypothetical protein
MISNAPLSPAWARRMTSATRSELAGERIGSGADAADGIVIRICRQYDAGGGGRV